jgi:UDP-N-acetylmuramate--alanine ligase
LDQFAQAFDLADQVLVLPIYASREHDTLGLANADVAVAIAHPDVRQAESLDEAVVWLATEVRPGDVVLTLGAGDSDKVGEWLLEALESEQAQLMSLGSSISKRLGVGADKSGNNGTGGEH